MFKRYTYMCVIWCGILLSLACQALSSYYHIACKQLDQMDNSCRLNTNIGHTCDSYNTNRGMPKGYRRIQVGQTVTYIKKHLKGKFWHDALRVCQSEGASLVKMDSSKKKRLVDIKFGRVDRMWIGLNDVFKNDTFYWTDGEPLTNIEAWKPGEPSHMFVGVDEDCVESVHGHKYMEDIPCHLLRGYLCETDPLK